MTTKELAITATLVAGAAVGGATLRSTQAAPATAVDLLDPTHPDTVATRTWRASAREFCDGVRAILEAQDRIHAAANIESVVSTERGRYVLTMGTSGGPITIDLKLPIPPDAGQEMTP